MSSPNFTFIGARVKYGNPETVNFVNLENIIPPLGIISCAILTTFSGFWGHSVPAFVFLLWSVSLNECRVTAVLPRYTRLQNFNKVSP